MAAADKDSRVFQGLPLESLENINNSGECAWRTGKNERRPVQAAHTAEGVASAPTFVVVLRFQGEKMEKSNDGDQRSPRANGWYGGEKAYRAIDLHIILVDMGVKPARASVCRRCPNRGPCQEGKDSRHNKNMCDLPIEVGQVKEVIARLAGIPRECL